MQQGNRDFDRGKYPDALISYRRALQIDPRFQEAHYKASQCFLKQGNWASAYQELLKTVDIQPDNWPAELDLGQLLLSGGKNQDAKDRALLILHSNPRDVDAQILLSDADLALGQSKDALQEAADATRMAPDRAVAYINLAIIQARNQAFPDAEVSLKKAQACEPASALPLLTLGNFYQQQKRWEDAEKQFQAAISIAPKKPEPWAALAGLFANEGQYAQAEKTLMDSKQQLSGDPAGYRLLGNFYLGRGDNVKALAEFASLSVQHTDDLDVQKIYAQLLISNHRLDEADKLDAQILSKAPQDPQALILKGQIELRQNKVDESIQTLQQAAKNAPENAVGHYQLGLAFQAKGNTSQAETEWREAVRSHSDFPEAWRALASNALQRQDWKALQSVSEQLKKTDSGSADGYLFHAIARINLGDVVEAELDLNRLVQLAPQSSVGYVKLGQLRGIQKRWDDAEKMYRQALALEPHSLDAIEGLVDVNFRRNKPAEALRIVQQQLQSNSTNADLFVLQGRALLQNKQSEAAEQSFTRAVEIDKNNLNALTLLGQVQAARGSFNSAMATYKRVIELAPNNANGYVMLGGLYESQSDWQKAQATYQKALEIQPDDPVVANNLAYLMLEHGGSVNVALTLAQKARQGLKGLPNSADTLGWAYYQNGAFSVATPLFEEAVKAVPANATYQYHLGLSYQKTNEAGRARAAFEKVISLDPKSPTAQLARQALEGPAGN